MKKSLIGIISLIAFVSVSAYAELHPNGNYCMPAPTGGVRVYSFDALSFEVAKFKDGTRIVELRQRQPYTMQGNIITAADGTTANYFADVDRIKLTSPQSWAGVYVKCTSY